MGGATRGASRNVPRGGATPRKNLKQHDAGHFDWQLWWHHHEDLFLYGLGNKGRTESELTEAADREAMEAQREDMVSILNLGITNGEDRQFREDCALTLGRTGTESSFWALWRSTTGTRTSSADLAQAAALGLAHTGNESALGYFQSIAKNPRYPVETRGIALAALGVLGTSNRASVDFLMDLIESPESHHDLKASASLALGFMRGSYSTEFLKKQLAREESTYLKSHLLAGLSLTCNPSLTETLLATCDDVDRNVQWSSILGLGGLLDGTRVLTGENAEDVGWSSADLGKARKKASATLRAIARKGEDEGSRALATVSLGRIGGAENVEALRLQAKNTHGQLRAFAVLALGLAGAQEDENTFLQLLADPAEVDHVRAAACIGLGVMRDASASARNRLRTQLSGNNPEIVRYYASLGLGLLRDAASGNKLARIVLNKKEPAYMRVAAATGLSLIGTDAAVNTVAKVIQFEKDTAIQARLLATLGASPTEAPAPFLLDLMKSDRAPEVKAAATHALGHIINQHRPPLFARLLCNRNYFLKPKPMVELDARM